MALPTGFQQTLLGEFSRLSSVLQPTNKAMDMVTTDVGFDTASVATVLNIPVSVPVDSQVVNQTGMGYVAPTYNGYSINTIPVTLTNLISYSLFIPNIDQINSPIAIRNVLVDPAMKAVENAINKVIVGAFTTTNFSINPVIATTASVVTPVQFNAGLLNLVMHNVDIEPSNLTFLEHPVVNRNNLTLPAWAQNYFVGDDIAESIRKTGVDAVAYGSAIAYDQTMDLLTTGSTGSKVYTSILMTKQAMIAVYRPVPLGSPKNLDIGEYVNYKGMQLAVELSYLGKDKGWYYNVSAAMGTAVIRPEQAQIFTTAQ